MKVTFRHKGDFSKTQRFMERALEAIKLGKFDKYGRMGVEALSQATPRLTGKTAESWDYYIDRSRDSLSICWTNSNVNDGVQIAVILQYGHGLSGGGYVEGTDYIRPAMKPVFEQIADDAWREVVNG